MEPLAPQLPHGLVLSPAEGIVLLMQPRRDKPAFSLGCGWRVEPRNVSVIDEVDCLKLGQVHENLIRPLPVGCMFQTLTTILPGHALPFWEAAREGHRTHPAVQAQLAHIAAGMPHKELTTDAHLRVFRTLATLRLPLDLDAALGDLAQSLTTWPRTAGPELARLTCKYEALALDRLRGLAATTEATLHAAGHAYERLNGERLGQHVALGLRPDLTSLPVIQEDLALNQQVVSTEMRNISGGFAYGHTDVDATGREVFIEDERCQVLTLMESPPQTYPGILCAPRAPLGSKPLALWNAWPGPITIAVNIAIVDKAVEEQRLRTKRWLSGRNSKKSVENQTITEELDRVFKAMMNGGSETHCSRIHVVLWGTEKTLPAGVDRVIEQGKQLKLQIAKTEGALGSTLFLQTLPLGFDFTRPAEKHVQRARRFSIEHLGQLVTLYGGNRGTKTPAIPLLNDRGEVVYWFPFDTDTNPHSAWTGTSGAGKTHNTAYIINHLMPLGITGLLVDPLSRYRLLNETWQGHLYAINFDDPPCFNPFFGNLGLQHRAFLTAFLTQLASGGGQTLTWDEFNILSAAVSYFTSTWNMDERGREPTITDFVEETLKTGMFDQTNRRVRSMGQRIATKLGLFYGTGPNRGTFANFVDGPNTFQIYPGLNVVELGELQKQEALQGILFFAIIHQTYEVFRQPEWRYMYKFAWFDEVWALDELPETANQVKRMIRTGRNDGISMHFLSQLVGDWNTTMGKVIRGIVGTSFFLKQQGQEIPLIKEFFDLSDVETEWVTKADKVETYASAYMRTGTQDGGMVRFVTDPFTTAQMSQDRLLAQRRDAAIAAADGNVMRGLQALLTEGVAA